VFVPDAVHVTYGEDATFVIQAQDNSGINHYWVNDTARFSVDASGVVTSIVSLPCGQIPLEIRAYDGYGHYSTADTMIVILDVTVPTITHPDDLTYTAGEVGNSIVWHATDDNPRTYQVLRDGVVVREGLWNSSSDQIVVSVDGLAAGLYSYSLLVSDAGGHMMSDSVLVTVLATTTGAGGILGIPTMLAIGISVASVAFAVIVIAMARTGKLSRKS
jgi:hypothetical protein